MEWLKCIFATALLIGSIVFLAGESTADEAIDLQALKQDVARIDNTLANVETLQAEREAKMLLIAQLEAQEAEAKQRAAEAMTQGQREAITKINKGLGIVHSEPTVEIPNNIDPTDTAEVKDADVYSDNEIK